MDRPASDDAAPAALAQQQAQPGEPPASELMAINSHELEASTHSLEATVSAEKSTYVGTGPQHAGLHTAEALAGLEAVGQSLALPSSTPTSAPGIDTASQEDALPAQLLIAARSSATAARSSATTATERRDKAAADGSHKATAEGADDAAAASPSPDSPTANTPPTRLVSSSSIGETELRPYATEGPPPLPVSPKQSAASVPDKASRTPPPPFHLSQAAVEEDVSHAALAELADEEEVRLAPSHADQGSLAAIPEEAPVRPEAYLNSAITDELAKTPRSSILQKLRRKASTDPVQAIAAAEAEEEEVVTSSKKKGSSFLGLLRRGSSVKSGQIPAALARTHSAVSSSVTAAPLSVPCLDPAAAMVALPSDSHVAVPRHKGLLTQLHSSTPTLQQPEEPAIASSQSTSLARQGSKAEPLSRQSSKAELLSRQGSVLESPPASPRRKGLLGLFRHGSKLPQEPASLGMASSNASSAVEGPQGLLPTAPDSLPLSTEGLPLPPEELSPGSERPQSPAKGPLLSASSSPSTTSRIPSWSGSEQSGSIAGSVSGTAGRLGALGLSSRTASIASDDLNASPRRKSLLGRLPGVRRSNSVAPEPLVPRLLPGSFLAALAEEQAVGEQPFAEQALAPQLWAEQPLAQQRSGEQPYAEQLLTEQPLAQQRSAEQPLTQQPLAQQHSAEQHSAEQPYAEQPLAQQRSAEQPHAEQPLTQQPLAQQRSAEQPYAEQPLAQDRSAEQSYAEQPLTQQPLAQQHSAEQPCAEQPSVEQPLTQQPLAQQHSAEQPYAEQPSVERPPAEQPLAEQLLAQQRLAKEQADVHQLAMQSLAKRVLAPQPLTEVQATLEPTRKQPFAEQPFGEQPNPEQPLNGLLIAEQASVEWYIAKQPLVKQSPGQQPNAEHLSNQQPATELSAAAAAAAAALPSEQPFPEQPFPHQPVPQQLTADPTALTSRTASLTMNPQAQPGTHEPPLGSKASLPPTVISTTTRAKQQSPEEGHSFAAADVMSAAVGSVDARLALQGPGSSELRGIDSVLQDMVDLALHQQPHLAGSQYAPQHGHSFGNTAVAAALPPMAAAEGGVTLPVPCSSGVSGIESALQDLVNSPIHHQAEPSMKDLAEAAEQTYISGIRLSLYLAKSCMCIIRCFAQTSG